MPIIPALGRLRRKVLMNLRTGLESELLLTGSSVLLWETLFHGEKKSECLATYSYKVFPFYDVSYKSNIHWLLYCVESRRDCSVSSLVLRNEGCNSHKEIVLICMYSFRIFPYCEVLLEHLSFRFSSLLCRFPKLYCVLVVFRKTQVVCVKP